MAGVLFDRGCVHMSNTCARGGTPALTPAGVHTELGFYGPRFFFFFFVFFIFPPFPALGVFLRSTLLCRGKIAQPLLRRADLNSAAHCAVMGGRGMDRP